MKLLILVVYIGLIILIVEYRIASRRIASHRIASHCITTHHIFKKEYAHPKHALRDDVDSLYADLRARFSRPIFI
jgi:hypothetical protein